jgi:lysine N-acyltransferase
MIDVDEALTPVLPRELTDISEAVRAVGAPPTPTLAAPYAIRLADPDADAEMVSEWMNRPHLVEAWEYDWPPSRWHRYLSAQFEG